MKYAELACKPSPKSAIFLLYCIIILYSHKDYLINCLFATLQVVMKLMPFLEIADPFIYPQVNMSPKEN